MTPTPYYERRLFSRTLEDEAQFAAWTEHLPIRENETPYHCGPHSLRSMRTAYEFAGKPEHVVEVGFCLGHSASIWFGLGAKSVISIENSIRRQTLEAAKIVKGRHGSKFHLLGATSDMLMNDHWSPCGFMFIDGGHEFQDVSNDIALALKIGAQHILFDDWFPKWGPGVQPAVEHHALIPLAIIGNMALCVPETGWRDFQ